MLCPKCNADSNVINSRMNSTNNTRYRRYECPMCKVRFSSREILVEKFQNERMSMLAVLKKAAKNIE